MSRLWRVLGHPLTALMIGCPVGVFVGNALYDAVAPADTYTTVVFCDIKDARLTTCADPRTVRIGR